MKNIKIKALEIEKGMILILNGVYPSVLNDDTFTTSLGAPTKKNAVRVIVKEVSYKPTRYKGLADVVILSQDNKKINISSRQKVILSNV